MKKYRFCDAYSKVYEYNEKINAYVFICTYYQCDISKKMKSDEKIKAINEYNEYLERKNEEE